LITAGNVAEENDQILEHLHPPGNIGLHTRQLAVTICKLASWNSGSSF